MPLGPGPDGVLWPMGSAGAGAAPRAPGLGGLADWLDVLGRFLS